MARCLEGGGSNYVGLFYAPGFVRLDEGFDLADSVAVPMGDYHFEQYGWFASTSRNRSMVLSNEVMFQRIFAGNLISAGVTANLAASSHLAVKLGYTRNHVDLPNGDFDADIGSFRLSYASSTNLVANLFTQYNSLENSLSTNLRLNFIHRPDSDLFVVFNEERGSRKTLHEVQTRDLVIKLTHLSRL